MATGNIKISDLTWLKSDNEKQVTGEEVFPISSYDSQTSSYSSYKVKINDVKSYVDSAFGLSDVSYMKRDLGQVKAVGKENNYVCEIAITVDLTDSRLDNSNSTQQVTSVEQNGFSISKPIAVKKGTLYLLEIPQDIYLNTGHVLQHTSVFTKYTANNYYDILRYKNIQVPINDTTISVKVPEFDKTAKINYNLEALQNNYYNDHYYVENKLPSSQMIIFLPPEDMNVIICAPTEVLNNKKLHAVNYNVFEEITDKFIGNNTGESKTIAEAIASLESRIASLEANAGTIGKTVVKEIDNINMPKYRGGEIVVIRDHAPQAQTNTMAADIPNHPGQIWIDTNNKNVLIAVNNNSIDDWQRII